MQEFTFKSEPVMKINMSIRGVGCEKASSCEWAGDACKRYVFALNTVKCPECGATVSDNDRMICDPTRRWMYCYAWKQKLGMVFDKELGVYILPETKAILMERARQ